MDSSKESGYDADVCIIGSGIAGTLLGTILARHGVNVLIFEGGTHPRFAIGESTVPETTFTYQLLSERYKVPEIGYLASFQSVRENISPACGIKKSFSFVHHEEGKPQTYGHGTQFPTFAPPFGPDIHFFRQDLDGYFAAVAAKYGCHLLQNTKIKGLDFEKDGVNINTQCDRTFRAKYVVDGSGYRSLLADKFGLREEESSLRTHSRSYFTHMVNVLPYDQVHSAKEDGLVVPHFQSTLHHMFEGGWIWVIPFNNHEDSTNPLCSVGVCVDPRIHPRPDCSPEEEFRQLLEKYPDVKKQFAQAKAIRPWVSTNRLQYSSTSCIGDRYCLLPHAIGFIDPFFSSGLALTGWAVNVLSTRLIKATKENDFSTKRFEYYQENLYKNVDYYDRLISNSFTSFKSFKLWNTWNRFWMIGTLYGVANTLSAIGLVWGLKKDEFLEDYPRRLIQGYDFKLWQDLFDAGDAEMMKFTRGEQSEDETIEKLFKMIREAKLAPGTWNLDKPEIHHPGSFTMIPFFRTQFWGQFFAPKDVRDHFFAARVGNYIFIFREYLISMLAGLSKSVKTFSRLVKDVFFSWSNHWKKVS